MTDILIWLCIVIAYQLGSLAGESKGGEAVKAKLEITKCQAELPRDQKCKYVITAVPEQVY